MKANIIKFSAEEFGLSAAQAGAMAGTVAMMHDLCSQVSFPPKYAAIFVDVIIEGMANGDADLRSKLVRATHYLLEQMHGDAPKAQATVAQLDKAENNATPEQIAQACAEVNALILKSGGGYHGLN